MKKIRIVIACKDSLLCAGVKALLGREQDIDISGEIEGCSQMAKRPYLNADVMLLDSQVYEPEELSAFISNLKIDAPRIKVLLLASERMSDESLMQYMAKGVDGYIRRNVTLMQFAAAIRTVQSGHLWAERRLLDKFVHSAPVSITDLDSKLSSLSEPLTKREKEIVSYLFLGLANKHISRRLHISEKTVKTHLNNIFRKMKVANRTQVVCSLIQLS